MKVKFKFNSNFSIFIALALGVVSGYLDYPLINQTASILSTLFMNLLKLIGTPIIFLSIFVTLSGMKNVKEFRDTLKRVIKYTLLTTYIAAFIALILYLLIDPASGSIKNMGHHLSGNDKGYLNYFMNIVPSNLISPFYENNVISILFLSILLGIGTLQLPEEERSFLHKGAASFNSLFMKIAAWVIVLIPIAVWSFITLFMKEIQNGLDIKPIVFYLITIVLANLIQGAIVLPALIKNKGISPLQLAKNMLPALTLAFFSKSSQACLPLTIQCAKERAGMSNKLSNMAFPMCTAINMNGCAAFIFTTVLFVSMTNGISFSWVEMLMWTFIATIAAIGNAGVPMGCYFLSTAFLAALNVPLNMMAVILPFYALLDMLETAINVWSDSCVIAIVDKELTGNEEPVKTAVYS